MTAIKFNFILVLLLSITSIANAAVTNEVTGNMEFGRHSSIKNIPEFESMDARISAHAAVDVRVRKTYSDDGDKLVITVPPVKDVVLSNSKGNSLVLTAGLQSLGADVYNTPGSDFVVNTFTDGNSQSGCRLAGVGITDGKKIRTISSPGVNCAFINFPSGYVSEEVEVHRLKFGFGLRDSLKVKVAPVEPGIYSGTLRYSLGPTGELSLGPNASYSDSFIDIPLSVEVFPPEFKITFPPGSEQAVLIPPGGWHHWINRSQRPDKLSANIPFRIIGVGDFEVYSVCEFSVIDSASYCGIKNDAGDLISFETKLHLPAPWSGQVLALGVREGFGLPLKSSAAIETHGKLEVYISNPGHINKLMSFPGNEFKGNITVVFDGDI